jgi:5-bromo-4-chloroindolyl phosphate hydrolysis protein
MKKSLIIGTAVFLASFLVFVNFIGIPSSIGASLVIGFFGFEITYFTQRKKVNDKNSPIKIL